MAIEVSREKFLRSVTLKLARTNVRIRAIADEIGNHDRKRKQETVIDKREINPLIRETLRGNGKS